MRTMAHRPNRDAALAALAGAGAALAILWTPVGVIEMLVASTGLSEAIPAAAPPLGLNARLLIAAFAALMAVGLVWSMGKKGGRKHAPAKGERKMGFALSKLTAFARGRSTRDVSAESRPTLRRADAHPDAPARAPIFANRDFDGLDIFNRVASRARSEGQPDLAMPAAPEAPEVPPLPTMALPEPLQSEPRFGPAPEPQSMSAPVAPAAPSAPIETLSLVELTERLERGLAQRAATAPAARNRGMMIADMPVAAAVPVRDAVEPDTDEALRAALGTLRTMAARTR